MELRAWEVLDVAVAGVGDVVELDLLVVEADGVGREDVKVPLVAGVARAVPGAAVRRRGRWVRAVGSATCARVPRRCHPCTRAGGPAALYMLEC